MASWHEHYPFNHFNPINNPPQVRFAFAFLDQRNFCIFLKCYIKFEGVEEFVGRKDVTKRFNDIHHEKVSLKSRHVNVRNESFDKSNLIHHPIDIYKPIIVRVMR